MPLIECVPNFSEGRRPEVIAAIRDAIAATPGVTVLDVSSDQWHNRTVITFVSPPERIVDGAFAGVAEAARHIDLAGHEGCHPRMGAADVVPFVPLQGATMAECVAAAHALGRRVGEELGIPVYLYEHAATRPERRNLADVRRGGFEGVRERIAADAPDYGPPHLHHSCGAVAVGARDVLVAYNVYLGPARNLPVAREVARAVRFSSGGLPGVKALALEVDGQAQLSMNLVDLARTPVHAAFARVRDEAARRGVEVTWSEIVGLVPEQAIAAAAREHLQLARFGPHQILEQRLRDERGTSIGGREWLETVAAPTPTPGGGACAAWAAALVAALAGMGAGIAARAQLESLPDAPELIERAASLRDELARLAERDPLVYGGVDVARRLPRDSDESRIKRELAIATALLESTLVPLEIARAALAATRLALRALESGRPQTVADSFAAACLGEAAATAASATVRVNVAALARFAHIVPAAQTAPLLHEAREIAEHVQAARADAVTAFERRLAPESSAR